MLLSDRQVNLSLGAAREWSAWQCLPFQKYASFQKYSGNANDGARFDPSSKSSKVSCRELGVQRVRSRYTTVEAVWRHVTHVTARSRVQWTVDCELVVRLV